MNAGFIQFSPEFGKVNENIDRAISMIEDADAELIVLPELFNTGYFFTSIREVMMLAEEIPAGKTVQSLCDVARKKKINIVAGLAEKADGYIFNSAVLVAAAGYVASYRKIHLFNEEKLWFRAGDHGFEVHDIGLCKIGMMVCFDWFFPESARILALKGADVICHPANLVLPHCQDAMLTRCLENKVFAITANRTGTEERDGKILHYTGLSQITSPAPRILHRADPQKDEIGVYDLDISLAKDKRLNEYNDLFADRRGEYYRVLVQD